MPDIVWIVAGAVAGLLLGVQNAAAEVTIVGNGMAGACSTAARLAARNLPMRAEGEQECTFALENESLSRHETAATYVDRGVLYLSDAAIERARHDFEQALKIEPGLPEAMVNRGAALIAGGHDAEGAAQITRGLALKATEPEKAYYNRGVAEERLGDVRSAYFDYRAASELKPDWSLPKIELARFTVTPQ